jgi:hypothetical protein
LRRGRKALASEWTYNICHGCGLRGLPVPYETPKEDNVDVREVPLLKLDSVDIPVDFPKNVAHSEVLEEFGHLEMKDSGH